MRHDIERRCRSNELSTTGRRSRAPARPWRCSSGATRFPRWDMEDSLVVVGAAVSTTVGPAAAADNSAVELWEVADTKRASAPQSATKFHELILFHPRGRMPDRQDMFVCTWDKSSFHTSSKRGLKIVDSAFANTQLPQNL